jgi:hypothetical protein
MDIDYDYVSPDEWGDYECREADGSPMPEHIENHAGDGCRRCGAILDD